MRKETACSSAFSRSVLAAAAALLTVCIWSGCSGGRPSDRNSASVDPYVGAAACKECHADIFQQQSDSPHALTFRTVSPDWVKGKPMPELRRRDPETGLDYAIDIRNGRLHQVAYKNGKETGAAPVDYLLGS